MRAFYRGLAPNLMGVIPEKALKLAVIDLVREHFASRQQIAVDHLSMPYGMVYTFVTPKTWAGIIAQMSFL